MCWVGGYFIKNGALFNVQNIYLTIFVYFVFFIVVIRDTWLMFEISKTTYFSEPIYLTWRQHNVDKFHVVFSINAFITGIGNMSKQGITMCKYITLVVSIYLLVDECRLFVWLIPSHQLAVLTGCMLNVFNSAFMIFTSYIPKLNPSHFYVTIFCAVFASILIAKLVQHIVVKNAMRRLDQDNYCAQNKPYTAYRDHIIGLIYGHPSVIRGKFIPILLEMYPNSIELAEFNAKTSLFLSHSSNVTNPGYLVKFYPFWKRYLMSLFDTFSEATPEAIETAKQKCEHVEEAFSRTLHNLVEIEHIILDETLVMLPLKVAEFESNFNRLTKKLTKFLMQENDHDDKMLFIKLYSTFFPRSIYNERFKEIVKENRGYVEDSLSVFTNILRFSAIEPDLFKSYKVYTCKNVSFGAADRITELTTEYKSKDSAVDFRYRHAFLSLLIGFICLFLPLIGIRNCMNISDYNSEESDAVLTALSSSVTYIRNCILAYPIRVKIPDKPDWFDANVTDDLKRLFAQEMFSLSSEIFYLSNSYNGHNKYAHYTHAYQEAFHEEKYYPLLNDSLPIWYAAQLTTQLEANILEPSIIDGDDGTEVFFLKFVDHVYELTKDIYHINNGKSIVYSVSVPTTAGFVISYIIGMFLIYFHLFAENMRVMEFINSLKETSKSELVRSAHYIKEVETNLGYSFTQRKDHKKVNYWLWILIGLHILALLCLGIYFVLSHCETLAYQSSSDIYSWAHLKYIEIAGFLINCLKGDCKSNSSIFSHPNYISKKTICPLCAINDFLYIQFSDTSVLGFINQWIVNKTIEHGNYYKMIDQYFVSIEEAYDFLYLSARMDYEKILENLQLNELFLTYFFVGLNILVIIASMMEYSYVWRPVKYTLCALSSMPYGILHQESVQILNKNQLQLFGRRGQSANTYYDSIYKECPDPTIIASRRCQIVSVNKAAQNLFFKNKRNYLMGPLTQISDNFKIVETGQPLTEYISEFIVDSAFQPDMINVQYTKSDSSKATAFYEVSLLPIFNEDGYNFMMNAQASCFAIYVRDLSDEVFQRRLAEEETRKHIQIIQSILPAEIAMQTMNKDRISFGVDRVAISFCDIVSFTPWCSSHTAEEVVKTLDLMFTIFDEKRAHRPSVTKIKCIGDCYMSASGIFGGKESAWVDIVKFCLDMIDAITIVNRKMGMNLQVRVGAALGGPISAGVMGIEKPSFDVWGEVVTEAQNMESGGKAMKVHINAPLYEEVKDLPLDFEQCPDGTWLVTKPMIRQRLSSTIFGDAANISSNPVDADVLE